jgi:arsenate reductase
MSDRPFNVLFLCTHNSARSVIAEAIMNKLGRGKFHAYSAGSQPSGKIIPFARRMLEKLGYDMSDVRSKSWNEFVKPGAPVFDFVFTVCDDAAGETCPVWPGQPTTAHWGIPDPSRAKGTDVEIATVFNETHRMLAMRIGIFLSLPIKKLSALSLQSKLRDIGRMEGATARAKDQS